MASMASAASRSPFDLAGRVALVTGSSRGLGAAMARALAMSGADVVLHASTNAPAAAAAALASECGVRTAGLAADLERRDAADALVPDVLDRMGRLDIVVNNAGIIRRGDAAAYTDADWDAVLEVNLSSAFRLCRAAGAHMLAAGYGKIVNIASVLSFQGGVRVPAYAAAKGGIAQLTKALANEWAAKGVNVNAIAPGYVRTDNTRALSDDPVRYRQILDRIPAGRWGEPDDLGGAIVFLASSASDYVHGHTLVVDGGWMGR
jgi:2-deoxy-D-gluconate 3-dehydrogenase